MSVQPKARMSVDEFLAWAEDRPGRHEPLDGEIVSMSPQRVRHAEAKFSVQFALRAAIREAGLPCRMLPDGMTVRVDHATAFEPDALVYCGEPLDCDATEAPEPVIMVELLSPGTKHIDTGVKLDGYFRVPSVLHCLVVDPKGRRVIHHRRGGGAVIETRNVSTGQLSLDPLGLHLTVTDLFRS